MVEYDRLSDILAAYRLNADLPNGLGKRLVVIYEGNLFSGTDLTGCVFEDRGFLRGCFAEIEIGPKTFLVLKSEEEARRRGRHFCD